MITLAFAMARVVEIFIQNARKYFYQVMLLGYRCPQCNSQLKMAVEGRCQCMACGYELDPTVTFQRCSACGGVPVLRVSRYQCRACGQAITARFHFDQVIFDNAYFCRKMAESRQRKTEQRERVRKMLAESRSHPWRWEAEDLNSVPGLIEALNSLTQGVGENVRAELKSRFDLQRYQDHICHALADEPVSLRDLPAISEDARLDLIWRFVAVIFLAHQRRVDIQQQGQIIWVSRHADRQGQDILGATEEIDGLEGLAG